MKTKLYSLCGFALVFMSLLAVIGSGIAAVVLPKENHSRKLLIASNTTEDYGGGNYTKGGAVSPERIGFGRCSKDSIFIDQGPSAPLPSGIPTYSVNIGNACVGDGCSISDIHVHCGWYSSARLVDPIIFRRIAYDDCLVNDGKPLEPGDSVSFQYADSFPYPISILSVSCST